jgi:hypothetical protein
MDRDEYDEMLRTLLRITVKQDMINDDVRLTLRQQAGINERLTLAIERLDVSVARLEALTARVFRQGDNGTDA